MNYDNYEAKIVERYGVALVGFPCKLTNPANLGRIDLEKVINTLNAGTCYWTKLSKSELEARVKVNQARQAAGEKIYKARKVAPRKQRGNPKSAETINEEEEEQEESIETEVDITMQSAEQTELAGPVGGVESIHSSQ